MANSISYASKYTGELDKMIEQKAKLVFLKDSAFKARFSGAKTVYIPELEMVGLGDYSRSEGYAKGDTTLTHRAYTLQQERSRQLFIDAQDVDESGVDGLVGSMVGEYTRLHVIPEIDAYCISKIYDVASTNGNVTTYSYSTALSDLLTAINSAEEATGYTDESLVAIVDPKLYGVLQNSSEMNYQLVVSDFAQGGINLKVRTLNGVPIIPVTGNRMKSAFTFNNGSSTNAGGFAPASGAKNVRAIVMPKTAASLIEKVDKVDVLNPQQVEDYDGYKINFRLYYDCLVKNSMKGTIFAISESATSL